MAESYESLQKIDNARECFEKAIQLGNSIEYGYAIIRGRAGLRRLLEKKRRSLGRGKKTAEPLAYSDHIADIEDRVRKIYGPPILEKLPTDSNERSDYLRSILPTTRVWTTVLVCDIRGFTTAFSRSDPEIQLEHLDLFLKRATELIRRQGGGIDKYIGDAVLAFFLPTNVKSPEDEDKAETTIRAIHAAHEIAHDQEIHRRFERHIRSFADYVESRPRLGIGVGIATGYAKFGEVGADYRREYTLIGRAVNLAFRIQAEARVAPIVAERLAWELVKDRIQSFVAVDHACSDGGMKGYEDVALVKVSKSPSPPSTA